jgi:catechol 2,3-dioxygenase
LYHLAILFQERSEILMVYNRIKNVGIPVNAVMDHCVNESIYFEDSDGNGVELYWDLPWEQWWNEDGTLKIRHTPINIET